jgi:pimeloyl-ACP methyl ester carboxylesterase
MNRHSFLALPCMALLAAACTGGGTTQFSAELVDIGAGRRMYVECDGAGAPTVLLVSGKGNRADTWSMNRTDPGNPEATVFRQVARLTRVCAYDRPSTVGGNGEPSRSDPAPEPVTANDGVADLDALLAAAEVRGPYVIVGHSYGGLIARLYASTFPEAVAGLVLEDALSEGLYDGLTPMQREILEKINLEPERVDTVRSFAQVTSAPPVQSMPMVILTADLPPISQEDVASGALPPFVTPEFVDALWTAQVAAQDRLAGTFPYARHVTNTNSRHYIHVEQPQVVVDAIRDVVNEVRAAGRRAAIEARSPL